MFNMVKELPPEYQPMIIHSLTSHVTREKAAWILLPSEIVPLDNVNIKYVAAMIELLWTAAYIYDDIEDGDLQRASMPSVWAKYGKSKALEAYNATLDLLKRKTNEYFPDIQGGEILKNQFNIGLISLVEHRLLSFDSKMEDIERNYYERACFHANLPFDLLLAGQENKTVREELIEGVQLINNAGQLLNDLKDLVPNVINGRTQFSDVRNAVITIPLKLMFDKLSKEDQDILKYYMGKSDLSDSEIEVLKSLIKRSEMSEAVFELVVSRYNDALNKLSPFMKDSENSLLKKWIDYKIGHAKYLINQ